MLDSGEMVDIESMASEVKCREDGIWVSDGDQGVSYPEEGNEVCYQLEDDSFWFKHRNRVIVSLVQEFASDDTFFDIGGGNGCVSFALQEAGVEAVLLEPGVQGAANAKLRGVRNVIQAKLETAGFADDSLAAVGAFDVIEHIKEDEAFLRRIFQSMKPGGWLFITVPAFSSLWSVDDEYAGHFRRYTTETLSESVERSGFQPVYQSYFFKLLVFPIALLRVLPSKLKLRKPASGERAKKEHVRRPGLSESVVSKLLNREMKRLKDRKKISFGSSCLIVARKPKA